MSVVFTNRMLMKKRRDQHQQPRSQQVQYSTKQQQPGLIGNELIPNIVLTTDENLTITNVSVADPLDDSDIDSLAVSSTNLSKPLQSPSSAVDAENMQRIPKPSIFRKISQTSQSNISQVALAGPFCPTSTRPCLTQGIKTVIMFTLIVDVLLFYFSLIQMCIEEEVVHHLDQHPSPQSGRRITKVTQSFPSNNKPTTTTSAVLGNTLEKYQRLSIISRLLFGDNPLDDLQWNGTRSISLKNSSQPLDSVLRKLEFRKSHFLTQTIFTFLALPQHAFSLLAVSKCSVSLTFTHTTISSVLFFLEWLQLTPGTIIEQLVFYVHLIYRFLCAAFCYALYRWKLARS